MPKLPGTICCTAEHTAREGLSRCVARNVYVFPAGFLREKSQNIRDLQNLSPCHPRLDGGINQRTVRQHTRCANSSCYRQPLRGRRQSLRGRGKSLTRLCGQKQTPLLKEILPRSREVL